MSLKTISERNLQIYKKGTIQINGVFGSITRIKHNLGYIPYHMLFIKRVDTTAPEMGPLPDKLSYYLMEEPGFLVSVTDTDIILENRLGDTLTYKVHYVVFRERI